MWVVGMGTIVEMDERGRVTIPSDIRRALKTRRLAVSLKGNIIELRPVYDERLEALEKFNQIKLQGDPRLAELDAAEAKHRVGGRKR